MSSSSSSSFNHYVSYSKLPPLSIKQERETLLTSAFEPFTRYRPTYMDVDPHRRCITYTLKVLDKSRKVQFLLQQLNEIGCSVPNPFFTCRTCDGMVNGGYQTGQYNKPKKKNRDEVDFVHNDLKIEPSLEKEEEDDKKEVKSGWSAFFGSMTERNENSKPNKEEEIIEKIYKKAWKDDEDIGEENLRVIPSPSVVLCEDKITSKRHTEEVMIHELIHAFDDCRANVNLNDCEVLACTEIRASRLSGECRFLNEIVLGNRNMVAQYKECVQRRVLISVDSNPNCTGEKGRKAIQKVWNACYFDTEPFRKRS